MYKYDKDTLKENLSIEEVFDLVSELGGEPIMGNGLFTARTICHGGDSHKLYYYPNTHLFHCYTGCGDASFDISDLVLRVNKIIKRVYKEEVVDVITYGEYSIDLVKRLVSFKGKEVKLTTLEFDLLVVFLKNLDKSFSREEILNLVWGIDYFGSDRVVEDLVRRLRKKMPKLNLNAIYGYGYRLS